LGCDLEEDVLCEWEVLPIGVLIVDSFGAFEDLGDNGVLEFGVLVFQMVVLDCAEVALGCFDFD
jgi:hypothetical protein